MKGEWRADVVIGTQASNDTPIFSADILDFAVTDVVLNSISYSINITASAADLLMIITGADIINQFKPAP